MGIEGAEKLYCAYLEKKDNRWEYGNSILYRMCDEAPHHDRSDIIVGKLWLIGRSYTAAIERRKNADKEDDFYYDIVAPKMLEIGKELDNRLAQLKLCDGRIAENITDVLETHKYLMDAFFEITRLEKRSLASKYLHFHCPDMFFIYDSRARTRINQYIKKPDKSVISNLDYYDKEYSDFVCRMLALQTYLYEKTGIYPQPRLLDSFLLHSDDVLQR